MENKKLLLIDGSGLAYRAFYALQELKTSKGVPSGAVYGFVNMFLGAMEKIKPDYVAASFDKWKSAARTEKYAEYKSTRQKQPENLTSQIHLIEKYLEILNVPVFLKEGYEADDVLATIAKKAEDKGMEVVILTGDNDFLQIVTDNIKVLIMKRGIKDLKMYDKDAVRERFNLNVYQLRDYKALRGDPSDNIPGVSGIGEVTAVKLLSEFGSVENMLNNLDKLSDKVKSQIEKNMEMLLLSKDLVTLDTRLDIDVKTDDLSVSRVQHNGSNENLIEFYNNMEFKNILSKIIVGTGRDLSLREQEKSKTKFILVDGDKKLDGAFKFISAEKKCAISILSEQASLYMAISGKSKNYFIDIEKTRLKAFAESIINAGNIKVFSDLKTFIKSFEFFDIKIDKKYFDVGLADYLFEAENTNSKFADIVRRHLNYNIADKKDVVGSGKTQQLFKDIVSDDMAEYLCSQAEAAYKLHDVLFEKIEKSHLADLYYNIELPLTRVLAYMEKEGITLDVKRLKELSDKVSIEINKKEKEIYSMAEGEFNINSPKQVGDVLFEKMKIPSMGKTKTGFKTDAQTLAELSFSYPVAAKILEYRELAKLKSTYIDALPLLADKNNKIYTTYNQTGTSTGRLSSKDPNLQNIPIRSEMGREIRSSFTASSKENMLIAADYSQIELRILAHLSEDEKLIQAFKDDLDIHTLTAANIFGVNPEDVNELMRRKAKEINFGINYGMGEFGLAQRLGIGRNEARTYIEMYFKTYPKVKDYIENTIRQAEKDGFVCTIFGRRRTIRDITSRNATMKKQAERVAINAPIQGSAADIIKVAMINLYDELNRRKGEWPFAPTARLLLQVHDELVLEAPESYAREIADLTAKTMSEVIKLIVPVKVNVSIGKNWNETK